MHLDNDVVIVSQNNIDRNFPAAPLHVHHQATGRIEPQLCCLRGYLQTLFERQADGSQAWGRGEAKGPVTSNVMVVLNLLARH
jgi:hypothetical protein